MIRCIREAGDGVSDSLLAARIFLAEVRFRATTELIRAELTCEGDSADVHEDVREALVPFFREIQDFFCGPECSRIVALAPNIGAKCDLAEGHDGPCHPCVGEV